MTRGTVLHVRMCFAFEFYFGIRTGLGTKNVAKELKKVSTGLVSMRNKKWFPQLADKRTVFPLVFFTLINALSLGRSTKIHLYWCMKTCDGSATDLQLRICNISHHYQVYQSCHLLHETITPIVTSIGCT